jgi:mannose-6-phosphate isomerase-like protein (cupin superfamily)
MHIIDVASLAGPSERSRSEIEGEPYGAGVSIILFSADEDGAGPALHQHPYPETFVIHSGQAIFTIGEETLVGRGGQIIVVPAFTPHKFAKTGPERFASTDIHANSVFITDWLDPDPKWRGR